VAEIPHCGRAAASFVSSVVLFVSFPQGRKLCYPFDPVRGYVLSCCTGHYWELFPADYSAAICYFDQLFSSSFQLEERREQDPHISLTNLSSLDERKSKFERSASIELDQRPSSKEPSSSRPSSALGGSDGGRKFSLPANINQHLMSTMGLGGELMEDEDVTSLQSAIHGHAARSKSLSILRTSGGRIHIARPWLKKKANTESAAEVTEESSGNSSALLSINKKKKKNIPRHMDRDQNSLDLVRFCSESANGDKRVRNRNPDQKLILIWSVLSIDNRF
jgi:hypothetical protein